MLETKPDETSKIDGKPGPLPAKPTKVDGDNVVKKVKMSVLLSDPGLSMPTP